MLETFAAFTVLEFTINTLTLFAMVLAIGLVIDDAIVIIENVEQHMERVLNLVEATEVAMAEVQGPVVAIAFVLAAVFAFTLTSALCAIILKPHEHGKKNFFIKFFNAFNNWFKLSAVWKLMTTTDSTELIKLSCSLTFIFAGKSIC